MRQVTDTPTGTDFTAISAGGDFSLALKSDGSLVSWGDDRYYGQVSNTPTGTNFVRIAAGETHSLAIIPEPSTFIMSLIATLGIAVGWYRRRKVA